MAGWAVVSHWLAGWGGPPLPPLPDLHGAATVQTVTGAADSSSRPSAANVPATVGPAAVPAFAGAAAGGSVPSSVSVVRLTATVSTSGVHT